VVPPVEIEKVEKTKKSGKGKKSYEDEVDDDGWVITVSPRGKELQKQKEAEKKS